MTTILQHAAARIWRDKDGKVVLWQYPNIVLWGWIILILLSKFLKLSRFKHYVGDAATAFLLLWACLELVRGVNYFRRALGLLVIAMIIISHV